MKFSPKGPLRQKILYLKFQLSLFYGITKEVSEVYVLKREYGSLKFFKSIFIYSVMSENDKMYL